MSARHFLSNFTRIPKEKHIWGIDGKTSILWVIIITSNDVIITYHTIQSADQEGWKPDAQSYPGEKTARSPTVPACTSSPNAWCRPPGRLLQPRDRTSLRTNRRPEQWYITRNPHLQKGSGGGSTEGHCHAITSIKVTLVWSSSSSSSMSSSSTPFIFL